MEPPRFDLFETDGGRVAEPIGDGVLVNDVQDAIDLIGNASYQGADAVLVRADQLAPEFLRLGSGLAGDVLQKFINYRMRLAVVGDFESVRSGSLRAFISESNRGRHVAFLPDREAALAWLGGS